MKESITSSLPSYFSVLCYSNLLILKKCGTWIAKWLNFIHIQLPNLFYFIPEYFDTFLSDIVRFFLRIPIDRCAFITNDLIEDFLSPDFMGQYIDFVSAHLNDEGISNPEYHEAFLTKLNMLLQVKKIMFLLESSSTANKFLVTNMISGFKMKNLNALCKNFLRIFRTRNFLEIKYSYLPEFNSDKLKKQFQYLMCTNEALYNDFLNNLLNNMASTLTNVLVLYHDGNKVNLEDREREFIMNEIRKSIHLLYDMNRVLETVINLLVDLFIEKKNANQYRIIDYLTSQIFQISNITGIGKVINLYSEIDFSIVEYSYKFISPIAGIIETLYSKFIDLNKKSEEAAAKDTFNLLKDGDSFSVDSFKIMSELITEELDFYKEEVKRYENLKVLTNFFIKISKEDNNNVQKKNVNEIPEDKLCAICRDKENDTYFIPCEHQSCNKCINIYLMNKYFSFSKKCPFCNVEVKSIESIKKPHILP